MKIISAVLRILWFNPFFILLFFFLIFLPQKRYTIFRLQGTDYSGKRIFSLGLGSHCAHQDHYFVLISLPVDATGMLSLFSFSKSLKQNSSSPLLFCSRGIVLCWASFWQEIKPPPHPEPELLPGEAKGSSPLEARPSCKMHTDFCRCKWHRTILKSVPCDICLKNPSLCILKSFLCAMIHKIQTPH